MGLRYSLCALLHRHDAPRLLPSLCRVLAPHSRSRLEHLTWSPRIECVRDTAIGTREVDGRGIHGFELESGESANHVCLSLLVQLEPELLQSIHSGSLPPQESHHFGCMWTSIGCGACYIEIKMTAATSAMSRALEASSAIHTLWCKFAAAAHAFTGYLDREHDSLALQLWPSRSELVTPDEDTLMFLDDADCDYSIDLFAQYVRSQNDGLA